MTSIIRYNSTSTADPTTNSTVVVSDSCGDEPYESLVPYLSLNVGSLSEATEEIASVNTTFQSYNKWTINNSSLLLDWAEPTLVQVLAGNTTLATQENAMVIDSNVSAAAYEWALLVIEDGTGHS